MSAFHLAQMNNARLSAPLDDPSMNDLADRSPGFVWRLADETGDGTISQPADPRTIFTLSVWESVEHLRAFAYQSAPPASAPCGPAGRPRGVSLPPSRSRRRCRLGDQQAAGVGAVAGRPRVVRVDPVEAEATAALLCARGAAGEGRHVGTPVADGAATGRLALHGVHR